MFVSLPRCVAVSLCFFMHTVPMIVFGLSIFISTCVLTFCSFECRWRLRRMRDTAHMLFTAPHVSDQSVVVVAHWDETLSCFGRRSSSAMRFDDAFWLLVSRPTARRCSSSFRFHFGRWSLSLSFLSAHVSDDHAVLRRRQEVRRLLTYRSFHELVLVFLWSAIVCRGCRCVKAGFLGS